MKIHRRSMLQAKILTHLNNYETRTITYLAEKVGTKRPSVSRSIRSLKDQGFVYRNHNGWHLTNAGKLEVEKIDKQMRELTEKVRETASRVDLEIRELGGKAVSIDDQYKKTFFDIGSLIQESYYPERIFKQFLELDRRGEIFDILYRDIGQSMNKAIKNITSPLIGVNFFNSSIKPLLDIQEESMERIRKIVLDSNLSMVGKVLNQNNLLASNSIDNLVAIEASEISRLLREANSLKFEWIAKDLESINKSYFNSFKKTISVLEDNLNQTTIVDLTDAFILPSITVASYTKSARDFIEADIGFDSKYIRSDDYIIETGDDTLDPLLGQLNPDFVEMRRGSWITLSQKGPDRLRHAASSQRELIRQFLIQLIPNIDLSDDNKEGPQIKARVRIALNVSETDADFINSVSRAVLSYYRELNKYTHHNLKHEEGLRAILRTGEGLLRFIITQAKKNSLS